MKKLSIIMALLPIIVCADMSKSSLYKPYIPENKGLDPAWVASLEVKSQPKVYRGDELDLIAMPCGGIGAGQLEITGKGKLAGWWIFNSSPPENGGLGSANGATYLQPAPSKSSVDNGFVINIKSRESKTHSLRLDGSDFNDIRFMGEYPVARFKYKSKDFDLPVEISSEVFSPFVPLSVRDSANPVTVVQFTVKNISNSKVDIDLGSWLENPNLNAEKDQRVNQVFKNKNLTGVKLGLQSEAKFINEARHAKARKELIFDRFEKDVYSDKWTVEGQAFGAAPLKAASVKLMAPLKDYQGEALASSFHSESDEGLVGKLISQPFKIERDIISFKIAGGNHEGVTCINLIVDDKVVRTATGDDSNILKIKSWDVSDFADKIARLEIVDQHKSSWGFVKVDDIRFTDAVKNDLKPSYGTGKPNYGNLSISTLDANAITSAGYTSVDNFIKSLNSKTKKSQKRLFSLTEKGYGTVISKFELKPQESKTVTFIVSWYYPNLYNHLVKGGFAGHIYANWYANSAQAAKWVADNYARLYSQTLLFNKTYHDTTLPYWLANRITMPLSTLACDNVMIHKNGRMYTYEGVNFCYGTCGHVYNFVVAIASLFPELERSVREMQDLNTDNGFDEETGRINFRGHDGANSLAPHSYASDAQSGYILKSYREHLHSKDISFLKKNWEKIKLTMNYHICKDAGQACIEPNGVLEGLQTFWDPMWYGPNPYNNTLYLAALRAAEEMATLMGEKTLAKRYHQLFESGSKYMQEHMWNGEYYFHRYPEGMSVVKSDGPLSAELIRDMEKKFTANFGKSDSYYYDSSACDAQQTFGQNWAHQLGLGYILPSNQCQTAAASIFKYNWTPDIKFVYDLYPPALRTLADTGEGALVSGAWPKVKRQSFENIHDKDDVWSGLEYQAACDMINEGLLEEALIVIKTIDNRYDAKKRNPWCEIEGAEHYSRAMHTWNILLTLSGYSYDGPAGKIGFSPKITPNNFKSFFSGAEGWGSYEQIRTKLTQRSKIKLKYGQLKLKTLFFDLPAGVKVKKVDLKLEKNNGIKSSFNQQDSRIIIELARSLTLNASQTLAMKIEY